jgi:hypothetical protein
VPIDSEYRERMQADERELSRTLAERHHPHPSEFGDWVDDQPRLCPCGATFVPGERGRHPTFYWDEFVRCEKTGVVVDMATWRAMVQKHLEAIKENMR